MFDFLKPKEKSYKFPKEQILPMYFKLRTWSLSGVFIGYMGYYLVRNNITLSTPYIEKQLSLTNSEIGTITGSMLIAYGISKGAMSVVADKAAPKKFMALGLILCAFVNVLLGFSNSFYAYVGFVIALGVFQGMGVGPSFITLVNWYPKKERGTYTAIWNLSHNIGGGIIAPIITFSGFVLATILGVGTAELNEKYWHINHFYVPAACAVLVSLYVLYAVKESPKNEGLIEIEKINELRWGGGQ